MTPEEVTAGVADCHLELDALFTKARDVSLKLESLVEEGVRINMVKHLVGKAAIHEAREVTGAIATAAAKVAKAHIGHFKIAQEKGIATPPLKVIAGVSPLNGTR